MERTNKNSDKQKESGDIMKKLLTVIFGLVAWTSLADVQHVAGGIRLDRAAKVDGVDYPANTTIWAESYPTQFIVRMQPSSGKQIFYLTSDADHGSFRTYPLLDGSFMLMPSPIAEDVVSYATYENGNVMWADANTTVPDAEQDGSEAKPFRVLQDAINAISGKSYFIVLVKKGVYNEGCTPKSDSFSPRRVNIPGKNAAIVRAVDGPEETFIVGEADPNATTPRREGWGEDAVRCVFMGGSGCCLQGFTLTGGYVATDAATKYGYKSGAGVYAQALGAMVLDCVISNCYGDTAAAYNASLARCRILENHVCRSVVSGGTAVSCEVSGNELVDESQSASLFSADSAYNCTIAGNVVRAGNSALSTGKALYNSIVNGSGRPSSAVTGENNWVWDFSNYSSFPQAGFTAANPRFVSTSPWDLHLQPVSPCLDSIPAPTSDNWGATYYKIAAGDVDGNRLRIAADGRLTAGAFQTGFAEGYPGCLYVDPVNGSDANDGWHANRAMRTLAAALTNSYMVSGDVVYAMPGVYNTGIMSENLSDTTLSRVVVPDGVRLVSTDGPGKTFIVGAPAPVENWNPDHDDFGCASNAVRCVRLGANATLAGFTVTNGFAYVQYASGWTAGDMGGGILYAVGSCVSNCDIVCCKAYRGSGLGYCDTTAQMSGGTFVNCRFLDNRSLNNVGQAAFGGGTFVNCLFDRSFYGEAAYDSAGAVARVVSCTFGPDCQFSVRDAKSGHGVDIYNTILMAKPKMGSNYHRCLFVTGLEPPDTAAVDPDCFSATAEEIGYLQSTRRHRIGELKSTSVAIGAAMAAYYTADLPACDVYGRGRVNGDLDLGCVEYWPPAEQPGMLLIYR